MLIYPRHDVKLKPIQSITSLTGGYGGFLGADSGGPEDFISSPSGDYSTSVTDGVTFYYGNHALDLGTSSAPSFSFVTDQPFYIGMIGASGSTSNNNAKPGLGGYGVALVTPGSSATFRVWSGVGGYYSSTNNTSYVRSGYQGGAGGHGNQVGYSPIYRIQCGGGGYGALCSGTGTPTTSNILAMVGSGGGSGAGGGPTPAGMGGGFNMNGTVKADNPVGASGNGGTTSSGGPGGSWVAPYAFAGNDGASLQGGNGGLSYYDGGSGGGAGWYGGGGGSGGGGYSGGSGGGGSGRTNNYDGHTISVGGAYTQTGIGTETGNSDLQGLIRTASNTTFSIPNGSSGYGMSNTLNGYPGHSGWAVVWSYHAF